MDTGQFIVTVFLALLGGSGISGILLYFHQERKRKEELQRSLLEKQLQNLYGPAYLAVSQIKDAFARSGEISDASGKQFNGKRTEPGEAAQKRSEQIHATIELSNSHVVETVIPARERLFKVLNDHLHLADPDDIEAFITFVRDYDYYRVEMIKGASEIPASVIHRLREISFCRPELTNCIEQKFRSKQESWRKLCGG